MRARLRVWSSTSPGRGSPVPITLPRARGGQSRTLALTATSAEWRCRRRQEVVMSCARIFAAAATRVQREPQRRSRPGEAERATRRIRRRRRTGAASRMRPTGAAVADSQYDSESARDGAQEGAGTRGPRGSAGRPRQVHRHMHGGRELRILTVDPRVRANRLATGVRSDALRQQERLTGATTAGGSPTRDAGKRIHNAFLVPDGARAGR